MASPVHSQQEYIATGPKIYVKRLYTGLAMCIAGESIFLYRASPVYSQMRYIGTGLVYTITLSTDGATLLSKLLVQSN